MDTAAAFPKGSTSVVDITDTFISISSRTGNSRGGRGTYISGRTSGSGSGSGDSPHIVIVDNVAPPVVPIAAVGSLRMGKPAHPPIEEAVLGEISTPAPLVTVCAGVIRGGLRVVEVILAV